MLLPIATITAALYMLTAITATESGSQPESPEQLSISTPQPLTPQWTNEHDLLILFEHATDRVALARLIIDECQNNEGLPVATRTDGLRIAGHACYRDQANDDAVEAFTKLNDIATSPRWKAEALRMLAQLSMNDIESDMTVTISYFKQAWEQSLLDDPTGQFASTKSILNLICALSTSTGEHAQALDYALQGIALFSTSDTPREKAQFIYRAYEANKALGDNDAALLNLNDLLSNHPDFQADNNFVGLPPILRLDVYNLADHGWDHPSEEFVNEVLDICYEPSYMFMPSRLVVAQRLGDLLESQNQNQAAINIRTAIRQELADQLASNTDLDAFLVSSLKINNAYLALDDAKLSLKLGDPVAATAILNSITSDADALPAHIVEEATNLESRVQAQMQGLDE